MEDAQEKQQSNQTAADDQDDHIPFHAVIRRDRLFEGDRERLSGAAIIVGGYQQDLGEGAGLVVVHNQVDGGGDTVQRVHFRVDVVSEHELVLPEIQQSEYVRARIGVVLFNGSCKPLRLQRAVLLFAKVVPSERYSTIPTIGNDELVVGAACPVEDI